MLLYISVHVAIHAKLLQYKIKLKSYSGTFCLCSHSTADYVYGPIQLIALLGLSSNSPVEYLMYVHIELACTDINRRVDQ